MGPLSSLPSPSTLQRQPHMQTEPSGLIFQEYEKVNQFSTLNDRISDIKRAVKFKPRGFVNDYREAVMKRIEAKNKLGKRKKELKKIL